MNDGRAGDGRGACVFRAAVIPMGETPDCALNSEIAFIHHLLNDSTCCQRAVTCCQLLSFSTHGQPRRLHSPPGRPRSCNASLPLVHDLQVVFLRDLPHRLSPDMPGPHLLVGDELQLRDKRFEHHRGVEDPEGLEVDPEREDFVAGVRRRGCDLIGCTISLTSWYPGASVF